MNNTVDQPQGACTHDCLRTIAYFTLQEHAVTPLDVWRWQYKPTYTWSLAEVLQTMRDLHAQSRIAMRDGRVVLVGHEIVFDKQHDQFLDAYRKWRKARHVAWWAALIPGVRAVAVGNTLAWEATSEGSDIDFFVVTRPGTLWLVRLVCVVPLIVFRARPGVRVRDSIDFTFFVTENALDLTKLRIEPEDPYMAYWLASLVPLVDDGVMNNLWRTNVWMQETLPNATQGETAWYRRIKHWQGLGAFLYCILRALNLVQFLDRLARVVSVHRFPEAIRAKMNGSTDVVVNDNVLKFHVTDNRRRIYEQWKRTYEALS